MYLILIDCSVHLSTAGATSSRRLHFKHCQRSTPAVECSYAGGLSSSLGCSGLSRSHAAARPGAPERTVRPLTIFSLHNASRLACARAFRRAYRGAACERVCAGAGSQVQSRQEAAEIRLERRHKRCWVLCQAWPSGRRSAAEPPHPLLWAHRLQAPMGLTAGQDFASDLHRKHCP